MTEIRKFLTCAAHHLPPAFVARLDRPMKTWPVCGGVSPFGFFLYAHDEDCNEASDPIPLEVMAIFAFARGLGCEYVYFDQDGEDIEGFPIFEPEGGNEAYRLYEETGDERLRTVM